MLPSQNKLQSARLLTSTVAHEDAAILTIPNGKAIVQTLDFFTPIVNNPFDFGKIAAANSLSDVYAMGAEPWCAMNIVCFPMTTMPKEILAEILCGGMQALQEAGAVLAGGHSVEDEEIKFGLSVTGIVDPNNFASNTGLRPKDMLILTKPLGTGILATGIKAAWDGFEEMEKTVAAWAGRLNKVAGSVITALKLKAATDITGFGLGGHLLEMATASQVAISINAKSLPLLPMAYELAEMGLVPAGSYANKNFRASQTHIANGIDPILIDIVFDAQTSGGLVLAVPEAQVKEALRLLEKGGEQGYVIGHVLEEVPASRHKLFIK